MEKNVIEEASQFVSPEERMQLVRLCAELTGDGPVAEDLAQETLLEAWRHIPTCILRNNSPMSHDARLPIWDLYQ